jgi:hypothetical protein
MDKIFTVYKTTNKINGKYYIGVHKTSNPLDDYYGSGKYLQRAVEKYGPKNFEKEVIAIFETKQEAYQLEGQLVTWELIESGTCYNIKCGGEGGFEWINKEGMNSKNHDLSKQGNDSWERKTLEEKMEFGEKNSIRLIQLHKEGKFRHTYFGSDSESAKKAIINAQTMEAKAKRNNTRKLINFQQGKNNSQFGTKRLYNLETGKFERIKTDVIEFPYVQKSDYDKQIRIVELQKKQEEENIKFCGELKLIYEEYLEVKSLRKIAEKYKVNHQTLNLRFRKYIKLCSN